METYFIPLLILFAHPQREPARWRLVPAGPDGSDLRPV